MDLKPTLNQQDICVQAENDFGFLEGKEVQPMGNQQEIKTHLSIK